METWKAGRDVTDLVNKRIDRVFPELTELKQGGLAVLMQEKAKERDGRVEYGTLTAAPKLLSLLTDKSCEYKFILTLGADHWDRLRDDQKAAAVDHFLCGIHIKYDDKTDQVSFVLRKPEIQMYVKELETHGLWMPDHEHVDTILSKWYAPVSGGTPVVRSSAASPPSPPSPPASAVRVPPKKASKKKSTAPIPTSSGSHDDVEEGDEDDPIQAWVDGAESSDTPSLN